MAEYSRMKQTAKHNGQQRNTEVTGWADGRIQLDAVGGKWKMQRKDDRRAWAAEDTGLVNRGIWPDGYMGGSIFCLPLLNLTLLVY